MDLSPSPETNILVDIGTTRETYEATTPPINDNNKIYKIQELKERIEIENTWKSCCLLVDRRALIFFSQLGISISVMALCIYQLITHHDSCDSNQLYTGILTMLIGIHLPSPKMRK